MKAISQLRFSLSKPCFGLCKALKKTVNVTGISLKKIKFIEEEKALLCICWHWACIFISLKKKQGSMKEALKTERILVRTKDRIVL